MKFGEAIEALRQGKRVTRLNCMWSGLFVFMQIPSTISKEIVPKM
jgi:hypothetical protein